MINTKFLIGKIIERNGYNLKNLLYFVVVIACTLKKYVSCVWEEPWVVLFSEKIAFFAIQIKDCIQYRKKNEISGIILSGEFLTFAKFCLRDLNSKFSSQDKVKIKNETHSGKEYHIVQFQVIWFHLFI